MNIVYLFISQNGTIIIFKSFVNDEPVTELCPCFIDAVMVTVIGSDKSYLMHATWKRLRKFIAMYASINEIGNDIKS